MKKISFFAIWALLAFTLFAVANASAWHGNHTFNWEWKSTSAVKNNPGVVHYVWEMVRPPYGPYDKIALHRFVYEGKDRKKRPSRDRVLFHLPGTWDTAWKGITDPDFENHLFFANNGYDVYSMDYRVSYLPKLPYGAFDASSTTEWTYSAFREDIKACVKKIKRLSGAKKIFLSGFSRGGTNMWIYASKYWRRDLKGLIGLDGGSPFAGTSEKRTKAEYGAAIEAFLESGAPLLTPSTTYEGFCRMRFTGILPEAEEIVGYETLEDCMTKSEYYAAGYRPPADYEINTASDLMAYFYNYAWNSRFGIPPVYPFGVLTNYFQGQMDKKILIQAEAGMELYWPAVQNEEKANDLDYDAHVAEIDLPVIFFGGILNCGYGGSGCTSSDPTYKCSSNDVTVVTLPYAGHMDVMWGLNSKEDVKEPLLEWMNDRQ